ncbi:putative RNA-binding protein YlmH [Gracilariopsis chorda]|uniref:Putative RNA-binding protein YlmH n=1 Tax=Gracilariopsis chorda TaxID=448386 RepID=A0A2V3IU20_9FLOR|nr:putative RNA-binding protein YlmH [Gracilariopsis chorda]|eukprot:PXF45603.1 putative RNA-binding protein YlmH [Gracilariopsis chorda]
MRLTEQQSEKLLSYAKSFNVDRSLAKRMIEMAERSVREWECEHGMFLTPVESGCLLKVVRAIPEVWATSWGGYDDAERCVIVCCHEDMVESESTVLDGIADNFVVVKLLGDFSGGKVRHGDFLGAVLHGAGLKRECIGDVMVLEERGAQVIATRQGGEIISQSVSQVANVKVEAQLASLKELEAVERRTKQITSVENSLRIDAVLSGGLGTSRTKMSELCASGLVRRNYAELRSASKSVQRGDVLSVRGLGKIRVDDWSETRKGRFRVTMTRFI